MKIRKYDLELDDDRHPLLVIVGEFEYKSKVLSIPEDVVDFVNSVFHLNKKAEECVYLLGFTSKQELLGCFEVSRGSVFNASIDIRGIMLRLLLLGTVSFVLVHNHPSGNVHPSLEDLQAAQNLIRASELIGLYFADSIIVGDTHFSMRELGVLPENK